MASATYVCGRHMYAVPGVVCALPVEREAVVHVAEVEADVGVVGAVDVQ